MDISAIAWLDDSGRLDLSEVLDCQQCCLALGLVKLDARQYATPVSANVHGTTFVRDRPVSTALASPARSAALS